MMSSNNYYNEKRDFIRMKIARPLPCTLTLGPQQIAGVCTDLSASGLQLQTDSPAPIAAEGEIFLQSDFGHKPQLHARVRVVRCTASADSDVSLNDEAGREAHFLIGLEILEHLA